MIHSEPEDSKRPTDVTRHRDSNERFCLMFRCRNESFIQTRRESSFFLQEAGFLVPSRLLKMTHGGNSLLGGQHHGVAVQAVHVVVVPPGLLGVHAQGLAVHHLVQDLWWGEKGGGERSGKLRTNGAK